MLSAIAQVVFNETGYEGSRRPCSCGNRTKDMKDEGKTYVTLVGEVRIGRATYRCTWCGNVTRLLDERLNLPSGAESLLPRRGGRGRPRDPGTDRAHQFRDREKKSPKI